MIVGQVLRQWLGDRHRQRDASAAARDFSLHWSSDPAHRRLVQTMQSPLSDSGSAVVQAVRELFMDSGWADALVGRLVTEIAHDPFFQPPYLERKSAIQTSLLLYDDARVSIALGVHEASGLGAKMSTEREPTSLNFTGRTIILKIIRCGGATLSFWEIPGIAADFILNEAARCVRVGERQLSDGEIVTIDGRQSYVIEHAHSDILMLYAAVKADQSPVAVEYDYASLTAIGTSATNDAASRIQLLATLLRKMDCQEAFPVLVEFLHDPNFFVRWHVMKELLGLNAMTALPHLRRLAGEDPHPEVRQAAAAALASVLLRHSDLERNGACLA